MKVLGLDIAQSSGYCILEGSYNATDYGRFVLEGSIEERLKALREHIESLVVKHKPDLIMLEDVYFGRNTQTYKTLCMYQAIVLLVAHDHQVEVRLITASQWKSSNEVRGRGRTEQKRAAQVVVQEHFGLKVVQDIVDSLLIAQHHFNTELNWE